MDIEQQSNNQDYISSSNTMQQQTHHPTEPMFGILIPGHPVRTDFVPADPSGLKYTITLNDIHPHSVSDIAFFLLRNDLQSSHGAMLFAQVSSSQNGFELLGAVTSDKPSGIFRTDWNTNNDLNKNKTSMQPSFGLPPNDAFTSISSPSTITFGVSIESIQNIQNLEISKKGVEDRVVDVAQKIALNLFNYLQSFDDCNGRQNGMMMVPVNIFERWITRFQNKYRMDPNFFMKIQS